VPRNSAGKQTIQINELGVSMRTRRNILHAGSAAIFAAGAGPAIAGITAENARSLAFANLHTGETLSVDYWVEGQYVSEALNSINFVLRDYRNNEVHDIEPKLLDLLNLLHRQTGSTVPFSVISGYRSPATNAMLHARSAGVASHSLHMKGMAIDIRLADRDLPDLHKAAVGLRAGGVGYYPSLDFVHVDVGRVRYWGAQQAE
jgi:uncharacterized protein YcbK (DUF882 family)